MDPLESFQTPTPLALDNESTDLAACGQSSLGELADEPPAAGEADSFEQAPCLSSSPWSSGDQSLGDLFGQLRSKLGPATSALKMVDAAQTHSGQLDLGFGALGSFAGPLSKLAGALDWGEGAAKIPQASRQLDEAWKAYQTDPSTQNAEKLKASFDAWRAAAQPLVEKIPSAPVAAQLGGMLEIATKLSGNMSVLFSERSEKAVAASQEDPAAAQAGGDDLVDPQLDANHAEIEGAIARDAAVPDFEQVPAELDRKLESWRSNNGLRALPERLQASRERVLDLHGRLAALREERSSSWSPSKRAELASAEKQLAQRLRETLGNLEAAASAAAPTSGRFLDLENLKRAL